MSNKVPRVFVSATSRDLGSFRKAVSEILVKLNALPVVQEHFGPDYRSIVQLLHEKIDDCDAAILLVGQCYGHEPVEWPADRPRRSYTQLEYETAIDMRKPAFVFVAADDCRLDNPADEPVELRGLQLEHIKRIAATDRIRMEFHSLSHLTDQVRLMRFDAQSLAEGATKQLVVLMRAELLDGAGGGRAGWSDELWVREVVRPFQNMLRDVLKRWGVGLQLETASEYEVNFETADAAVNAGLALHRGLHDAGWQGPAPGLRVGIHMGQILRFSGADESRELQIGRAMDVCRQLTRMAAPGQTLLTRSAFNEARQSIRQALQAGEDGVIELSWRSYGRYLMSDSEESQEVCEVGVPGRAPLTAPPDSAVARRADSLEERQMQGWRPGLGQEVPHRPGWFIERKLGEGGFGEVWVARQKRNPDLLVFKFCFDAKRLSSFKREQTLFRLLNDTLGNRPDIARLRGWELEKGPFFLESEHIKGGNLLEWCEIDDRLASLPLEERLRLMAEIAVAVAAAHSVGIIHKDLKPSNILMRYGPDDRWHPMLADFGIGAVADRTQLEERGITVAGFTRSLLEPGSSLGGTWMYQPPEANLARPATVQGDVYALGVLLFQMIHGDFKEPLGHGWERRLLAACARGFRGRPEGAGEASRAGEAPSESRPQTGPAPASRAPQPLPGVDPSGELILSLLKGDIGDCVDSDPAARLASVAQLLERLQTMNKRVADAQTRRRAELARLRMRRILFASPLLVTWLIGAPIIAVLFYFEGVNQKDLRQRAEAAEIIAMDTVDQFFTSVSESDLIKVPKMEPLRNKFLALAIKHLDEFPHRQGEEPRVKARVARAHFYVGRMYDLLGRYEQAVYQYSEALRDQVKLVDADPTNPSLRHDLAETSTRMGLCYFELPQKKDMARKALETSRDVLINAHARRADQPGPSPRGPAELGDAALDFQLAKTYIALGYLDKRIAEEAAGGRRSIGGNPPSAREDYETAKAILDRLIQRTKEDNPRRLGYEHQRALIAVNLGNLDRDAGRGDEAGSSYRAAADFWRGRLDRPREEPGNPPTDETEYFAYRNGLAQALTNLVALETARGRISEAEKFAEESVAAGERLVTDFGYDECKNSLARNHLTRGVLHLNRRWRAVRRGEREEAAEWAKKVIEDGRNALKIFDRLDHENPGKDQYSDGRGWCYLILAAPFADDEPRSSRADLESALDDLAKALKIFTSLNPAGHPKSPDHQSRLAMTWRLLGDTHATRAADSWERDDVSAAASQAVEAEKAYRTARELADDLITHHKQVLYASQAGQHYCHNARFLNQARDFKRGDKVLASAERAREASELAERSITILSDTLRRDRWDDRARLYLIYSHQERALARARLGDIQGAAMDAGAALGEAKTRAELLEGQDAELPVPLLYGLATTYARASMAAREAASGESVRVAEAASFAEKALEFLEAAAERGLFADPAWCVRLAKAPDFQPLQSLPRFQRLGQSIKPTPTPAAR